MRRLIALAFLLFATCGALADVNITNIPVALGVGTNDTLLGVTNSTHAALVPARLLNQLFTSSLLGTSNQYTGGFVGDGTYLTHLDSGFIDWFAVEYDFTNAYFTNFTADGAGITNIPASSIVGAVAEASHATNADNTVSATYVTTSPLTNHVNIANVDAPSQILTNYNAAVSTFNASLVVTGANYLALSNGTARVLMTNGTITTSGQVDLGGSLTAFNVTANASGGLYVGNRGYWQATQRTNLIGKDGLGSSTLIFLDPTMAIVPGTITATNGMVQMIKPSFTTNFTCTTNLQTYLCNGTNQIVTLPNAAYVPNIIYRFTSTNGYGSYIVTNATGSQTIRDGVSLSHKQIGIAPFAVFSDGAQWWLAARDQSVEPNAQFSCSTNIPLTSANTAYPVTFNSTDFNNSQGIALALGTNGTHFSKMWITNSGQYEFTPSIVIGMGNVSHTVRYWFRSNDTNIPASTTPTKVAGNDVVVITVPFVVNITTPTAIEIWAESDGVNDALTAGAASGNYPAAPSVICPVKRISDTWP